MKKITLCIVLLMITLGTHAQITFNEAIGGPARDQAISAEVTTDGGYIVVGWTQSYGAGGWDIYLVKTSETGIIQWTKTYGGPGEEVDCYVHQTYDGGFIITARTTSFNVLSADVYLIKTDGTGTLQWTKTVGGSAWDEGHSMVETQDSGFVHSGITLSFGAGDHDFYAIRSDKNGNTIWTKSFGGTGVDNGHLVISALDGGFLMLGETNSFGAGGWDYYLVKMDANGNYQWSKTYGGTGDDNGWDIKATTDSCYVLAGYTTSFGAGNEDVYVIKINRNGDVLWSRTYGNTSNDIGLAIKQTEDGGFVITGETTPVGSDSADVYLVKTDQYGLPEWSSTFGGLGDDGSQSVEQTADKGYFISGYTNSFGAGDWDFYLIKTDSLGHTAYCNPPSPVVLVSNATSATITGNPLTQTSSGGVTGTPVSAASSGGTGTFCNMFTGIESANNESEITIYPNPATNTIALTNPSDIVTIEIYNQLGQVIQKQKVQQTTNESIDITNLTAGVYQIRFNSKQSASNKRFVKMN